MKKIKDYGDIMTVKDVQQLLGIGKNTVYALLHNGVLKYKKIGGKFLIPKHSVIDFINN